MGGAGPPPGGRAYTAAVTELEPTYRAATPQTAPPTPRRDGGSRRPGVSIYVLLFLLSAVAALLFRYRVPIARDLNVSDAVPRAVTPRCLS